MSHAESITDDPPEPEIEVADLRATLDLLDEENRRLRDEVARIHQQRYRNTAIGLAAIGFAAVVAAILFPDARAILFTIGAIGLFSAVLVHCLTPESVITAHVGERVYTAMATNEASICDALGLADIARYVNYDDEVRLFVPHLEGTESPPDIDGPFVTDAEHQGLLLVPTGAPLFEMLESVSTDLTADALADAVTEQFELARQVVPEVTDSRATFAVAGSYLGDLDRFDHPIASLLAVGLASALATPVELTVEPAADTRYDWLITCRWSAES